MAGAVSLRLDRRSLGAVSAARPGIGPAAAVAFRPLLLALSLAAQVEAEAARLGLHAGFLEGTLEAPRVALQQVQRPRRDRKRVAYGRSVSGRIDFDGG